LLREAQQRRLALSPQLAHLEEVPHLSASRLQTKVST
jgi:hypothetical protein